MRLFTLAAMAVSAAAFGLGMAPPSWAESAPKLSGPFVHENLAVYFIHSTSADGPVPLTLAEALANGTVHVRETGSVNNLEIENTGASDVFIQAGDIVKGGQQDRVLMMSMVLPSKSGKVPIGSFCVEQGRWSKRGAEDVKRFASAADALPSREAKLAMKAPAKAPPPLGQGLGMSQGLGQASNGPRQTPGYRDETSTRQRDMWAAVEGVQGKLSSKLGAPVASPQSSSSLQLSLENEKLKANRAAYIADLEGKAADADITGYVIAINGHINSADQYPSNGLFRKMWPKLLAAGATEAIGEQVKAGTAGVAETAPDKAEIATFLARAEAGVAQDQRVKTATAPQDLRDSETALYVEARRSDGSWVHRNYLAK